MESEPIIVGGEESGGLSVKGHVPEKDGILACLLMAELVATERRSLGQILEGLEKLTGEFHSDRLNVKIPIAPITSTNPKLVLVHAFLRHCLLPQSLAPLPVLWV